MLARASVLTLLFAILNLTALAAHARSAPLAADDGQRAQLAERGLLRNLIHNVVDTIETSCKSGGFLSSVLALVDASCGSGSGGAFDSWKNATDATLAHTPLGTVKGVGSLTGITYSVPYAKADRWELSSIVPAWSGTFDGTHQLPSCPQPASFVAGKTMSEDCLSLVVYRPAGGREIKNLPVFVWVHGGSFVAGSAAAPGLDGRAFANANQAVVVVVQYRLGVLGLLPPPTSAGTTPNLAVGDVINALTFVQKTISSFGGDPKTVTVAGQSSGGHMIRALLASPKAQGLFSGAILQSDPMSFGMSTPSTTAIVGNAFYTALGTQLGITDPSALKKLDWATLVAAQAAFTPRAFILDNSIPVSEPLRPTAFAGDAFLPADFSVALAGGKLPDWALKVPLVLTTVTDEFAPSDGQLNPDPIPAPALKVVLSNFIGEEDKVEAILNEPAYALGSGADTVRDTLNKIGTEGFWTCAARYVAGLWAQRGGKVFVGEFAIGAPYPDNQAIPYCSGKVCHEDDIFLTFGTTPQAIQTTANRALSTEVLARWGHFLRFRYPSPPGVKSIVKWNAYTSEEDVRPLGASKISRTCPAGFWGTKPALFDWQMYSVN